MTKHFLTTQLIPGNTSRHFMMELNCWDLMGSSSASFCRCYIGFSVEEGGEQGNWRGLAKPQKALDSGFGVASINCSPCSQKAERNWLLFFIRLFNTVTWRLSTGIVEPEDTSISKQRLVTLFHDNAQQWKFVWKVFLCWIRSEAI
jgi:hypothetical protein